MPQETRFPALGERSSGVDPLFPTAGLLPLSDPGGGRIPLTNTPGLIRPFAAALAVRPPYDAKKHDTNPSRWTEQRPTEFSRDGVVEPDTQPIEHTDT